VLEAPADDDVAPAPPVTQELDGCTKHADCGAGMGCRFEVGSCGNTRGACTAIDAPADDLASCDTPVCGCDGRAYPSACDAWKDGVSVLRDGDCSEGEPEPPVEPEEPAMCGGVACGAGEFCLYNDGTCGGATGACTSLSGACTSALLPVCGCDGQTYASRCEALRAGVSLEHDGAC
jgi:hypothetical protein